jgi:hypothetical protein
VTVEVQAPAQRSATDGERTTRRSPVTRILAQAPAYLVVLLMAVVLRYSALRLDNLDTWFHLTLGDRFRSGEWSLSHPGSLTPFGTSEWVATQWSTQVAASLFEGWFGLPGVAWLFGSFYLVLLLTVYVVCRRRARALPAAIVLAMVVFGTAPAISARPQVVSLILLAVTVHAWLETWHDQRFRWWLVPLTWVWATAHGLWSAGVLLGFVVWFGMVLERRVSGRRALSLLALPVLCLGVTALTPVGPTLLTSQFAVSARSSLIAEWGPTSFRTVSALTVAAMIALLTVLWSRRGRIPWTWLLLLLLAAGWTLLVTRMVALGAVVVAPLLAQALEESLPKRVTSRRDRRAERAVLGVGALGYLVVLALVVPHTADEAVDVPVEMTARLQSLPTGTPVVVEDGIGAWMEWAVPGVDPMIDGMLDSYPVRYIEDFTAFKRVEPGWQDFLADSGARVAVVVADSPLTAAMKDQLQWTVVQEDADWVYLVAPDASS